jgi:small subunit ribosomal protein S16
MAVKIRLQRHGRRNRAFFRIVAADARSPRDGRFIERLGTYDPVGTMGGDDPVRLDAERVTHWLGVGAQPSETVASILKKKGIALPWKVRAEEKRKAFVEARRAAKGGAKKATGGSKSQKKKAEKAAAAKAEELGLDSKKAKRAAKKAK